MHRFLTAGACALLGFAAQSAISAEAPVRPDAPPALAQSEEQTCELARAKTSQKTSENTAQFIPVEKIEPQPANCSSAKKDPSEKHPQVRLIGTKTDVAKRYRWVVPPFPVPPFIQWRQWYRDHEDAVHCALEWCDESGNWWHGEMRSTHFDQNSEQYRVGFGEFPGTAYDAYGVYVSPGRINRDKDSEGRPVVVTVDEEIPIDYRQVLTEVKSYAAKDRRPGDPGTGGKGKQNVGLGGPAYKPAQNSNTMINFVLRKCGIQHPAPEKAVGWDRVPDFPYSSNADSFKTDNEPY